MDMAKVPDECWPKAKREISFGAFYLYGYYCRCRNKKTGTCWPSIDTAARAIEVDRAQVSKWRKELVKAKWIRCEQIPGRKAPQITPLAGFNVDKTSTMKVEKTSTLTKPQPTARRVVKSSQERCEIVTVHIRKEPAHEPAKEVEQSLLPDFPAEINERTASQSLVASLPLITQPLPTENSRNSRKTNEHYEIFAAYFHERFGIEYRNTTADFVQLARLRKSTDLTMSYWARAVENYFCSPMGRYTLADLASRVEVFEHSRLDKFNKPITALVDGNRIAIQRFLAGRKETDNGF